MMHRKTQLTRALLACAALAGAATVQAATSWNENFGTCANGSVVASSGTYSAYDPCGSGTTSNVRVSGVATSGGSVIGAAVYSWGGSGLGVVNNNESSSSTGPHAIDSYGSVDALALNFVNTVSLTGLTIGWNGTDNAYNGYNDSDLSVYAWTGGPSGPTNYNKATTGWSLIGTYMDVGASNGSASGGSASVATSIYSSYWLVSALGNNDNKIDAFKLLSVAGVTGGRTPPGGDVPEPGSLALLGLGALGLVASRRRAAGVIAIT